MSFILFVAVIVLWYSISELKKRVAALEEQLSQNGAHVVAPKSRVEPDMLIATEERARADVLTEQRGISGSSFTEKLAANRVSYMPQGGGAPVSSGDDLGTIFISWLKKDPLMKVGAFFILLVLGWVVSLAFMSGLIGPGGRIALGLAVGALFLGLAVWRIQRFEHQGAVFAVLGSSSILLTLSAARHVYGYFTPSSALFLMFLSVVFVAFLSVRYARSGLAIASLLLAALAPHLTALPTPDVFEQFTYLFVVVLGTLWVVFHMRWRNLTAIALTIVFLETLPYLSMSSYASTDVPLVLLWVFLFVAVFFIANIVSIVRMHHMELLQAHVYTACATALFLILWVFGVAPEESQSLLFVFWMLVFALGTFVVYRSTDDRIPFYIYGGTSIALLASATAAELQGAVLTIAFTFEVAVLVFVSSVLKFDRHILSNMSLLFIVPGIMTAEHFFSRAWVSGVFHAPFFTLLIFGLIVLIIGLYLRERERIDGVTERGVVPGVLITAGMFYGLSLIWLVLHALFAHTLATTIALVLYTCLGVAAYLKGKAENQKVYRVGGWVLLGLVIMRLIFVEIWQMELEMRVVTFLIIGVLLISTAFMGRTLREEER